MSHPVKFKRQWAGCYRVIHGFTGVGYLNYNANNPDHAPGWYFRHDGAAAGYLVGDTFQKAKDKVIDEWITQTACGCLRG